MRTQHEVAETAEVQLRLSQFIRHCKSRGLHSAHARAKYIGVHHATVGRIEADARCGERFIAQVLAAFPELRFEDLFEVVIAEDERLRDAS